MADSNTTEVIFEELSDAEYARCQFPEQAAIACPFWGLSQYVYASRVPSPGLASRLPVGDADPRKA